MTVTKLSVSFDEELAGVVREAAADEGLSVSAWLSNAAQDRIRNRLLRVALDELALEEGGPMSPEEAARLVQEARRHSIVTGQGQHHAA